MARGCRQAARKAQREYIARSRSSVGFRLESKVPSEELFDEIWSAAKINIFHLPPGEIAKWAIKRSPHLLDEIILFGISDILAILRKYPSSCSASAMLKQMADKTRRSAVRMGMMKSQSEQFSRIVEMLDAHRIGEKLLGDCTKGDLLRAAADAEALAGESVMSAQFYRLMAGLLPEHGVTVRQANNRKEIVALLTTTFKEDGESEQRLAQ